MVRRLLAVGLCLAGVGCGAHSPTSSTPVPLSPIKSTIIVQSVEPGEAQLFFHEGDYHLIELMGSTLSYDGQKFDIGSDITENNIRTVMGVFTSHLYIQCAFFPSPQTVCTFYVHGPSGTSTAFAASR